ncbi:MAG: hypothetical protein KAG94_02505 [Clostridiales bacterium]|nr:hypothetical protein [Clostridiales bacterium]
MDIIKITCKSGIITFDKHTGSFISISIFDGLTNHELLDNPLSICQLPYLVVDKCKIDEKDNYTSIEVKFSNSDISVLGTYEVFNSGYIIGKIKFLEQYKKNENPILFGVNLSNKTVFSNNFEIKNDCNDDTFRYNRAFSVNFSTDERLVTNSVDFILENLHKGKKIKKATSHSTFIGWEVIDFSTNYENRWLFSFSKINNHPNKVRGQRIVHFYGLYPRYPTHDMLEEYSEYGCSILILHMPVFTHIDGSIPYNEFDMKETIKVAHEFGIKILFYSQPFLISKTSETYNKLKKYVNSEGENRWNSLKDTQIVFYEQNSEYDCDELCIRNKQAYDYMKNSTLNCYRKYNFDGLYIDFAWPGQGICKASNHNHEPDLFNFYDYLTLMREYKAFIGDDAIMIGHGGSIMVGSDMLEGFDGCLTGEGQKELSPDVIGVQYGCTPTLWTMHRRKQVGFRSTKAMAKFIKEGITPHIGQGIMGQSVLASHDLVHTPHHIAYWQIYRAFPIEKATYYNYLNQNVVNIDHNEITYSLYVTDEKQVLLIIANGGGELSEKAYAVSTTIQLDINLLKLPLSMNCWSIKGNTYETIRIVKEQPLINGQLTVQEIGIHEFMGFIFTVDNPPKELVELQSHLENRFKRLVNINEKKIKRLIKQDKLINEFTKGHSQSAIDPDQLIKDRAAE